MSNLPTVLIIDGQNFAHRARVGLQSEFSVIFNMFRSLRPVIEKFKPNRCVFTREGKSVQRLAIDDQYKANRKTNDPEKIDSNKRFFVQLDLFDELCAKHIPISIVRHPLFEADDLIYNLIKSAATCVQFIVVSTDTDFIQLLQEFQNVKLYNPCKKEFVEAPKYDYVVWKSLVGDGSDNIAGLPGFGPKTAEKLLAKCESAKCLEEEIKVQLSDVALVTQFEKNLKLIRFIRWTEEEAVEMTSTSPTRDWEQVALKFHEWSFNSILKDGTWDKFKSTFDTLWHVEEENETLA